MLNGNIKYLEDPSDNHVLLPITHINAVRDSEGTMLPDILDRDYPTTSKTPVQDSTEVSLCTRGEKYNWNAKADAATTLSGYGITDAVSTVSYDSSNKKITKTINGTTTDVVTAANLYKDSGATAYGRKTDFDLSVLKQAVADGDLGKYGLKVGDQKTITNGDRTYTYVIAELNPMKGTRPGYTVTTNHVGLVVLTHTTQKWNVSGNTYTGSDDRGAGYMNSDLHYYLKNTVLPNVRTDLGSNNLVSHHKLLSNAVNTSGYNKLGEASGCSSSWAWEENCYISALSECQVYGAAICSSSLFDTGEACKQLEVFQKYKHTEIFRDAAGTGYEHIWLRDVVSASHAPGANLYGHAAYYPASYDRYVAALILFN